MMRDRSDEPIALDVPHSFTALEIRALQQEYLERQRAKSTAVTQLDPSEKDLELANNLSDLMFGPQRAFFDSPATRKLGFCTRRAGKTIGIAIEMLRTLLRNPTSLQLYFAQTSLAAKTYIWPEVKKLIRTHRLPITWNEQDLWLIHKNGGGKVLFRGVEDDNNLDKHRGPAYIRVYIDEAGHFKKDLRKLMSGVIGPALRDLGGQAIMTGTAGPHRAGYFYEACIGKIKRKSSGKPVWEVHEWSLKDNPHLPARAKNFSEIIDDDGFSGPDDPVFLREYKKVWAVDVERRMFAFNSEKNVYQGDLPPDHDWMGVLGIDFGWNDQTAMAAVFYALSSPNIYVVETWAKSKQFTDEIAAEIFRFKAQYGELRIIGDVGGYGKGPCVHLARDYGIHVTPAKKREKLDHLAFFNSALKRGELLIKAGDALIGQFPKIEWNPTKTGAANHATDDRAFSTLYGWREAKSCGAGSRVRGHSEPFSDSVRDAAIKEKLAVLGEKSDQPKFAHHALPNRGRAANTHRRRISSFHQLSGIRQP